MKVKSESEVAQSYLTLRDPMDRSLPGSAIYGIFQAREPEWGPLLPENNNNFRYPLLLCVSRNGLLQRTTLHHKLTHCPLSYILIRLVDVFISDKIKHRTFPFCFKLLISRDITLPTKVRLVKAMVFPVVM